MYVPSLISLIVFRPTTEGLLAEVFSNEGVGTLIHANEYQAVRKAHRKDARTIFNLIQAGIESDELAKRSRAEIERRAAFVLSRER